MTTNAGQDLLEALYAESENYGLHEDVRNLMREAADAIAPVLVADLTAAQGDAVAWVMMTESGSIGDKIAPVAWMTFQQKMDAFNADPWITSCKAKMAPLYTHPAPPAPVTDASECLSQAAAALDVLGRRDLSAWLMRTAAALPPAAQPAPVTDNDDVLQRLAETLDNLSTTEQGFIELVDGRSVGSRQLFLQIRDGTPIAVFGHAALSPAAQRVDGWVACSERLPQFYLGVMAWNGYEVICDATYQVHDGGTDGKKAGLWYDYADDDLGLITHWMPLPEPPAANAAQEGRHD